MINNYELTFDHLLLINELSLLDAEPFGVIDKNKILSSLSNQFQPYPSYEQAFASLYKSIILNHGFLNGNKRTAVIALYIGSKMIDNLISITDENLVNLTYKIADVNGSLITVEEITKKLFNHETCNTPKININIKKETIDYINNHYWLIKELAK